jgi:hypothetical protein
MPTHVPVETTRQMVDAFVLDQAIRSVISKFIRRIGFVDQRGEPNRFVVLMTDALAFRILPAGGRPRALPSNRVLCPFPSVVNIWPSAYQA